MWSMNDPQKRNDFLDRLSVKYQTGQLLLCWHPGAGAIWIDHFLVINRARFLRILKYLVFPERATEAGDSVFTVWATLFAKFYLCLAWQRLCCWRRIMMKGVLIWRRAAQQCETHKVVATKLNFNKHTLHGYIGNCEEWSQWMPLWAVVSVGTW